MRDAFGGTFVIKLIIIFIVIYISFMAVAVQYAKTFRVKNLIINKLEQSQYNIEDSADRVVLENIADELGKVPYNVTSLGTSSCAGEFITSENVYGTGTPGGGYCLETKGETGKHYYKVTTYIQADLSFLGISITIPVSGETKIIYTD